VGHAPEDADVESSALTTVATDEAHFAYLIAEAADLADEAHLLGDVVADPPEIDDIAAPTKAGRLLEEENLVPCLRQPVAKSRPGDADSVDDDLQSRLPVGRTAPITCGG
jgi:hypothetical protein